MMKFILFFCFLALNVTSKELPDFIPICRRNQATISDCLKKAAITLQPYVAKGVKELNVPPLEPLEIPMIKLEHGSGAVVYKATLTKIKVSGLSNYVFKEFNVLFNKNGAKINGNIDLPKISLTADYESDGRILLVPIKGSGDFSANITNCIATFDNTASLVTRKGLEYLQTKGTQLHIQIGDAQVYFDNLFNGDPVLTKTTNEFLNQNSKDVLNEIKPAIEAIVSMLIDDILSKVFRSTSYDKLFPK